MPYLKIKVSNEPGKEWTTINNLNLDKIILPSADGLVFGDKTLSGELNSMQSQVDKAIEGIPDTPSFEIYEGNTEPEIAGKKGLFAI